MISGSQPVSSLRPSARHCADDVLHVSAGMTAFRRGQASVLQQSGEKAVLRTASSSSGAQSEPAQEQSRVPGLTESSNAEALVQLLASTDRGFVSRR